MGRTERSKLTISRELVRELTDDRLPGAVAASVQQCTGTDACPSAVRNPFTGCTLVGTLLCNVQTG
jgi:hypothetical protein